MPAGDKRCVEQGSSPTGLVARPILTELSPAEFETLVTDMFGKMRL
jgi:hypothetical protein